MGNRLTCHSCFVGIDGDRNASLARQTLDDGQNTAEFLLFRQCFSARTRGFSADVENVSSVRDHLKAVGHRALRIEPQAAVGK